MMEELLFESVKAEMPECNKLPQRVKDILNTAKISFNELNKSDTEELWVLLHDCVKDTSVLEDTIQDRVLLKSYHCVLNLVHCAILCAKEINCVLKNENLTKSIMIFQSFYSINVENKFKLDIVQMYLYFWKLFKSQKQNGNPTISVDIDHTLTQNIIFNVNYLFDTIESTTVKSDMQTLSIILWEFWNIVKILPSDENKLSLFKLNLEKHLLHTMFLETEFGKLTFANVFTVDKQLFWRFHELIRENLLKASKVIIGAYGEIYYLAWKKSNATIREVIEQELSYIIRTSILLQRVGPHVAIFNCTLDFLQSLKKHRSDIRFSRVVTQLYAPILWRQLTHQYSTIRCNALEMLTKVYPLEKRGEVSNVTTMFLIRQQDAILNGMTDNSPEVRVVAIQGICFCLRQFWYTFKENQIMDSFKKFLILIEQNEVEVRKAVFRGFALLLDKSESHSYFKDSELKTKIRKTLMNEDEEDSVRCALLHFLLKVKKLDSKSNDTAKINYKEIVNLQDIAIVLAQECEEIRYPIVDLIFDYFIEDNVLDKNLTITRFNEFYKINSTAFRNMIYFSKKKLDFNNACKLMLTFLQNVYCSVTNNDMNDSENIGVINTLSLGNNDEENKQNKDSYICCILDCVNCLILVHYDTFIDDSNRQQFTEIENSCITCITELLKYYKDDEVYISTISLAALIPISKLSVHTSEPSLALSTLKQMPNDLKHADELVENLQDCLVYTLCMWNQGNKIIQFVKTWFDNTFKTLNLNETLNSKTKEEECVFETDLKECKPKTGIALMTSMLTSTKSQYKLMDFGINENHVYDMILCLQNIIPAIEKRMFLDRTLNDLLSDEVLIELFYLYMRLNIVYYHYEICLDYNKIVIHQISIFDWIMEKLLTKDLQDKNDNTKLFIVQTIKAVNSIVFNSSSMSIGNHAHFNKYLTLCTSVVDNHLGPWILVHTAKTLRKILDLLNSSEHVDHARNDMCTLNNCVSNITNIISIFEDSNFNEEDFKKIIGEPKLFRDELSNLVLELYKLSKPDFHQIFLIFIETIMIIIDNDIRKTNSITLDDRSAIMPFSAFQLTRVILHNAPLMRHFSANIVEILSSRIYQNDCVRLLSAIYFIYNITFSSQVRVICDFSPILKLLYKTLTRPEHTTIPLSVFNSDETNLDMSIFESPCATDLLYIKARGRNILISTANKLRLTLCD